jgi:hypothetical protein
LDGLLNAYKNKILADAKIEPAEKVKELEQKLSTLQKTVGEYEQTLAAKDSEVTSVKINTELYKHIPAPKEDGPALDQDDIIDMMRRKGYDYKLEGGKVVVYKDGQKMTDKVGNDLGAKDVVESFLKERKLITEAAPLPTGRGAGDGKQTTVFTKFSEVKSHFEAQGKSINGEEFMNKVNELAKSPDFKMTE